MPRWAAPATPEEPPALSLRPRLWPSLRSGPSIGSGSNGGPWAASLSPEGILRKGLALRASPKSHGPWLWRPLCARLGLGPQKPKGHPQKDTPKGLEGQEGPRIRMRVVDTTKNAPAGTRDMTVAMPGSAKKLIENHRNLREPHARITESTDSK